MVWTFSFNPTLMQKSRWNHELRLRMNMRAFDELGKQLGCKFSEREYDHLFC